MKNTFLAKNLVSLTLLFGIIFFFPKPAQAVVCGGFDSTTVTMTNTTCVVSGVMGIDNPSNTETSTANSASLILGNANVNPAQPLFITINPGSALSTGVLTIRNDVTISIADGGQILSGRALYMEDKDADGWPASGTVFTSTSSGRRRLGLMRSLTVFDCSDNSVNGYNPTNSSGPWYQDVDGDGVGRPEVTTTQDCTPPVGYAATGTDCNDGDNQVAIAHAQCYNDADGDGYTAALNANTTCLNSASCNTATRASLATHGAAVTSYTAGRIVDAQATADCNDIYFNANNLCSLTATGGTITTSGDYKYHTFYSSGTFTVTALGGWNTLYYLVVAGGGGGAGGQANFGGGGGGGAGGMLEGTITASVASYGVTIGGGGAGGAAGCTKGTSGANSVFYNITATGGGGGGNCNPSDAFNGGSGGGAGSASLYYLYGTGIPGQGNNGGPGQNPWPSYGGGGGGAGSAGVLYGAGAGKTSSVNGGYYSAGGAAGRHASYQKGGSYVVGVHGPANSGNGGGAGTAYRDDWDPDNVVRIDAPGGNGGSGIVVVKYQYK